MKVVLWSIVALVALVLLVGLLGHILLLAALTGGGFLLGRGYEHGKVTLARRKARGSLGR
jgi:hypothetical protein